MASAKCLMSGPLLKPVEVIDSFPSGNVRQLDFADLSSLEAYLDDAVNGGYACRLISICQSNSWRPLQITDEMLRLIQTRHDLGPSLWDLVSVFYQRDLKTEQAFCVPYTEHRDGVFLDIAYTIRYPELKSPGEWTIRQTGIYHRVNTETAQSTLVLLNPTPRSKLHCECERVMQEQKQEEEGPFWIHQKLFAMYVPAWRQYIASLELRFLPTANRTSVTYLGEELRLQHKDLTALVSIQQEFMQISVMLAAAEDVLAELSLLIASTTTAESLKIQQLKNIQRQCAGYSRTAAHLQDRVQAAAQLLSDTLLFRDQMIAMEQNGNMLQLNKSAFFLTVLSLFYLPASFLTSFFGMNFFGLNQTENKITATPMIWIFVLSAVLLTASTFLLYYWLAHHDAFTRAMAPKKWMPEGIQLQTLKRRLTWGTIDSNSV